VPFEAKLALIKGFQNTWKQTVNACFDRVQESLCKLLEDTTKDKFKLYANLQTNMAGFTTELVKQHQSSCRQFLEAALECEDTPFTQNHHYLEANTERWLSRYKDTRTQNKDSARPVKPVQGRFQDSSAPSFSFGKTIPLAPPVVSGAPLNPPRPIAGKASQPTIKKAQFDDMSSIFSPALTKNLAPAPAQTARAHDPERVNKILSGLAELGYVGLKEEDLGKLNPVDEYERELVVMAEVRGYFKVAYKRIIDNAPSLIDLKFVKAFWRMGYSRS